MKKLIKLTFIMLFFTSMANNTKMMFKVDCTSLAIDVYDAYFKAYKDYEYAYQAANWAYEGCANNQ